MTTTSAAPPPSPEPLSVVIQLHPEARHVSVRDLTLATDKGPDLVAIRLRGFSGDVQVSMLGSLAKLREVAEAMTAGLDAVEVART